MSFSTIVTIRALRGVRNAPVSRTGVIATWFFFSAGCTERGYHGVITLAGNGGGFGVAAVTLVADALKTGIAAGGVRNNLVFLVLAFGRRVQLSGGTGIGDNLIARGAAFGFIRGGLIADAFVG